MWFYLDKEEFEIIDSLLEQSNLHGLRFMLKSSLSELSPYNPRLTKSAAIKAAITYFSADDLIIESDFVKWDENGDALVMSWQKVPQNYITEDCGCLEKH
jgi:hypothetical protein